MKQKKPFVLGEQSIVCNLFVPYCHVEYSRCVNSTYIEIVATMFDTDMHVYDCLYGIHLGFLFHFTYTNIFASPFYN